MLTIENLGLVYTINTFYGAVFNFNGNDLNGGFIKGSMTATRHITTVKHITTARYIATASVVG